MESYKHEFSERELDLTNEYMQLREKYGELEETSKKEYAEMKKNYENVTQEKDQLISQNEIYERTIQEYAIPSEQSSASHQTSMCTPTGCLSDDDQYKLECRQCKRLVHYKCTRLPHYQIQQFMTNGYRKYVCENCTEVQPYLSEVFVNLERLPETEGVEVQKMEEELKNISANLENKNREHNRLMSELHQITEVSKNDKLKLTLLQSKVTYTRSKIK